MSFIWFSPSGPLQTQAQVANVIYDAAVNRGLDKLAAALCLMAVAVEVGATDHNGNPQYWCPWNAACGGSNSFPYDSQSDDGGSVGYLQQQQGPNGEPWWGTVQQMMTLSSAADTFMARLPDDYSSQALDGPSAGVVAQDVQGSAFPDRYAAKWDEAWGLLNAIPDAGGVTPPPPPIPIPAPQPEAPVASEEKPSYNEFPLWTTNSEDRGNVNPYLFILHTQEGGGGNAAAEDLADFCISTQGGPNPVSYHYYISQASDGGVTLVDGVDTDLASWSVGDANDYSINLCFAGSSVSWTRDQWMTQSNAIDVAAYQAASDCQKYAIPTNFIGTGGVYDLSVTQGVTDHLYVTQVIGWGTHTDVGVNFPKDYFQSRFEYWVSALSAPLPAPEPAPVVVTPPVPVVAPAEPSAPVVAPTPAPAPAPEPEPTPTPVPVVDPGGNPVTAPTTDTTLADLRTFEADADKFLEAVAQVDTYATTYAGVFKALGLEVVTTDAASAAAIVKALQVVLKAVEAATPAA